MFRLSRVAPIVAAVLTSLAVVAVLLVVLTVGLPGVFNEGGAGVPQPTSQSE